MSRELMKLLLFGACAAIFAFDSNAARAESGMCLAFRERYPEQAAAWCKEPPPEMENPSLVPCQCRATPSRPLLSTSKSCRRDLSCGPILVRP
jgi:hypothetical protein